MRYVNYTLLHLLFSVICLQQAHAQEENKISIPDLVGMESSTITLPIYLDNTSTDITGLQFDLTVPQEVMTLRTGDVTLSERKSDHAVIVSSLGNGKYRFLVYSPTSSTLKANSGELITIGAQIADAIDKNQTYPLQLSNVSIGDTDGNNVATGFTDGTFKCISCPDFTVSDIQWNKSSLSPGDILELSWKVSNIGNAASQGGWSERIIMVDASGAERYLGTCYNSDATLGAGSTASRTASVALPLLPGLEGSADVRIELQPNSDSGEGNAYRGNNTAQTTSHGIMLSKNICLTLPKTSITEGEESVLRCKLTRSGHTDEAKAVTLTMLSGDSRVTLPQDVSIPQGLSTVFFDITLIDNDVIDNDSRFVIQASVDGYDDVQQTLLITDDELRQLTLSVSESALNEGDSFTITVQAYPAPEAATTLVLACDNSARFDFPSKLVLPAGETSVTTTVTVIDDNDIAETISAAFIASAEDFNSGQAIVLVNDNDMPHIELVLSPTMVMANAGANAIMGTIRRSDNLNSRVTVVLSDDGDGLLTYSTKKVILERGVSEAYFTIGTKGFLSTDREVNITAAVYVKTCDCPAGEQSGGSATQKVTLLSTEGAAMKIEPLSTDLPKGSNSEGLVVSIEEPAQQDVVVNVTSDYDFALDYANTVTIPAGETFVTVPVLRKDGEDLPDGQVITFAAFASGYATAVCWTIATASCLPDAVVDSFEVSKAEAEAGSEVELTIAIKNNGSGVLSEGAIVKVMLSDGSYPVVLKTETDLSAGETTTITTTYELPSLTGDYAFLVTVNPAGKFDEVVTTNNLSQEIPITIRPSYHVTAETEKTTYSQGEVITVTGKATGTKSAFSDVEVYFVNDGMRQSVIAKTDREGNYTAQFLPHDGTSGHFVVGACYPGEGKTAAMAEVNTYGLSTKKYHSSCQIGQGSSISGSFPITNPGNLPQTGISVASQGLPKGCEISIPNIDRIEGGQTIDVPYTINASDKCVANGKNQIKITLTTNEGSKIELFIDCTIAPAQGCLETDSHTINTTMTLATARDYPIIIWNKGQAQTGIITLSLPSWIQSLTPRELPSLAPDDSTKVILRIMPSEKMALNIPLEGHVGMNCAEGTGLAIDLQVTPVSEQSGTLTVDVTDYLTYCTAEKPHLQGAEVRITNRATQTVIAEGITGADGKYSVIVPEGWYELNVSADYHYEYNHDVLVDPGVSQEKKVFLEFNGIEADLEVRETEVEDEYSIVTKMTFEAQVPPPTIDVIWPVERPRIGKYFPVTVVNRGLIQLFEVQTDFYVSTGNYDMEILGNPDIDTLAAQQSVVLYAKLVEKQASSRKNASAIGASIDNSCLMLNGNGSYCYECGDVVKTSIQPAPFATWGTCTIPNSPEGGYPGGGYSGGGYPDPSSNDSWPQKKDEFACELPKFKLVAINGDWTSIPLKGIATDGMSKIKVVLDVNKEEEKYKNIINNITDIEWSMSEDVGNLQNTDQLEGLVYTAPESFSWEGETSHNIILNLSCKIKGEPLHQDVTIELIRIPVVLVHGIRSDPSCWNSMIDYLGRHGYRREMLKAVNYQRTHNDSFETNKEVVGEQTKDFLEVLGLDYACSCVDVVAHSMGGLLTKKYIQNHASDSRIFHKVITINTPHGGSQLGDLMNDIKVQFVRDIHYKKIPLVIPMGPLPPIKKQIEPHHQLKRSALRFAYSDRGWGPSENNIPNNEERENTDISQGAVYDLRVDDNKAIGSLNVAGLPDVNCHAIVTSSFLNQDEVKVGAINIFDVAECLGYTSIQDFANDLYNGDANDYVVATTSQCGGYPFISSSVTLKGGDYSFCHVMSCQNTVVQDRVLELLSTTDGNFFSKGFGKVDGLKYKMEGLTWENILSTYPVNGIIDVDDLYSRYYNKLTEPEDKLAFENWRRGNQTNSPSRIRRQSENSDVMESSYLTLDHNFVEGDSVITIKINSVGDFTNISFGCFYDGIPICMAKSDEGIVRLPDKIKGDIVIMYEGLCSDGSWWASADTITVNTIGNTHINKIEFAQNSLLIINNEYLSPSVICTWSDGMVTKAENPTLSVANGNLAYIEENKYVYGKNPGYTKLTASYNGLTCSAPLEVLFTRDTEQRIAEKEDDDSNSVCSTTEFEFKQKSVMTRQAFRGTLTINNNHPSMPLLNLRLHLEVRDDKGKLATEKEFQISPEALNGDFEGELDFDSGWNLKGQGTGVATILFIPTKNASPTEPKLWYFGGTLSYTDPFSGLTVNHALRPVGLTVNPSPVLDFTYFLQRDVFGDDPLTPQFEPSQPTEFALLINNKGYGDAKNLKFVTQKPQVIDNEKGLKINLDMVSAQLNGEETALMLDDNNPTEFGTIPARSQAYAQWWMQSSLLGHFIEYDVNATHVTSLGNEELSLLDQVSIHELIHGFTPEPMDQDTLRRGFLVNDVEDSQDLPDRIYFTDGSNQPSYIASDATIVKQSSSNYLLTITPLQQGWVYGAVNDPLEGKMIISKIVRQSDGKEMPVDNFWQTDRTLRDGKKPLYENMLHFIVNLSTVSEQYLLTFAPKPDLELAVEAYEGVPEEGVNANTPIEAIQVKFNKPIDESSFTTEDIKLFYNGTAIDASGIGISKVDEQTFSLALGSTTAQDGLYVLIVQTAGITDAEGFAGIDGKEISWVQASKPDSRLPIVFADAEVKLICVENWDTSKDGELSYGEAAAVTDLGLVFKSNSTITSFEELAYFTGLTEIPDESFRLCTSLQSVVLPENLQSIGLRAFWNCKLQSIIIPNNVQTIAQAAFADCGLSTISIPASVTSIGNYVFAGNSQLSTIVVDTNNPVYDSRNGCNAIINTSRNELIQGCVSTIIPSEIKSISDGAFELMNIEHINLPQGLERIGFNAFYGCPLREIVFPEGLTYIGRYSFNGCDNLTEFHVPQSVQFVDGSAIAGCGGITSISVADGNANYSSAAGSNAITNKDGTVLVMGSNNTIIPSTVKSIEDDSFRGRWNLAAIEIPESVESIGGYAFCECSSLTSIVIPKNVTEINEYAFANCTKLRSVTLMRATPISIADRTFDYTSETTLYVPFGSKADYETANVWKEFKEIVEVKPDNFLYANEATIRLGDKKTIALQLDNTESLVAADFRLQLPTGLSIDKDENGNFITEIVSARRVNHTLTVTDEGNGLYHFLSYSNLLTAFKGNAGDFITVSIVSDGSMQEGSYTATLKNIIFSDENEKKLTFANSSFNISVINYTPGDTNTDGNVDVMDVVKMVNYIMGRNPSDFNFIAADLDDNKKVNVMDLVNLIDLIMSMQQQTSGISAQGQLGVMELSKSDDETVAMSIPFANRHVAAQFVVSLTDGAVLENVVTDKAHKSQFTRMDDGRYKVMVYSGSNAAFSSDSPIKLQLSGSSNVKVEETMFVDTDEEAVAFETTMLNTVGINTHVITFPQPADIYTVDGKLVKKDATSTQGLAKGVYVVNNQKVIVK